MKRCWVIFFYEGKELLRYTLQNEGEDERQETINLLAYENDLEPCEICYAVVER